MRHLRQALSRSRLLRRLRRDDISEAFQRHQTMQDHIHIHPNGRAVDRLASPHQPIPVIEKEPYK